MNAPGSEERDEELRGGAMFLAELAMRVTGILVLGGWSLTRMIEVAVYFQNPAGGAPRRFHLRDKVVLMIVTTVQNSADSF